MGAGVELIRYINRSLFIRTMRCGNFREAIHSEPFAALMAHHSKTMAYEDLKISQD